MTLKRPKGPAGTLPGLAHANWKPFGDNVPERAASTAGASANRLEVMGPLSTA